MQRTAMVAPAMSFIGQRYYKWPEFERIFAHRLAIRKEFGVEQNVYVLFQRGALYAMHRDSIPTEF